jgi:hypothetical protein
MLLAFLFMTTSAFATTYTYVGSWEVDQGVSWTTAPPAYSGQQAAALLFGGTPSQYVTTTVFGEPTNEDAWVSTWGGACGGGFPCGTIVADNSVVNHGGLYLTWGDQSTYVDDWAVGSQYTNYAYISSPEPLSATLLGFGLIGLAGLRRKLFS